MFTLNYHPINAYTEYNDSNTSTTCREYFNYSYTKLITLIIMAVINLV